LVGWLIINTLQVHIHMFWYRYFGCMSHQYSTDKVTLRFLYMSRNVCTANC